MAYDTRTDTGIPTEPVGSLPRPTKLQEAFAAYDAGEITKEALEAEALRTRANLQNQAIGWLRKGSRSLGSGTVVRFPRI